jgi:hypothetical protein
MRILLFFISFAFSVTSFAEGSSFDFAYGSQISGGVGGYPDVISCSPLTDQDQASIARRLTSTDWGLAPDGTRITTTQSHASEDLVTGVFPQDYGNPYVRVIEGGQLLADIDVSIEQDIVYYQLAEVLDFEVPSDLKEVLVLFEPDPEMEYFTRPGMFASPDRPFLVGAWPFEDSPPASERERGWMGVVERRALPQSAYWSIMPGSQLQPHVPLFLHLTDQMDPAVSGRRWHIAFGHSFWGFHGVSSGQKSVGDIRGRLRVWGTSDEYRPPMAIQFAFSEEEQANRTGFFDDAPPPAEVQADNPGQTLGEARRWLLFRAAEDLLDDLDFTAPLPIRINASFFAPEDYPNNAGLSAASMTTAAAAGGLQHVPGRLARETVQIHDGRLNNNRVPTVVLEREAGTTGCLTHQFSTNCFYAVSSMENVSLPYRSAGTGMVMYRDEASWGLGTPAAGRFQSALWRVMKHEILHVLGVTDQLLQSHSYVATFDPPRHAYEAPPRHSAPEGWYGTIDRLHFYGPHSYSSELNPWRDTEEPGVRIEDSGGARSHPGPNDFLANWRDVPDRGGVMRSTNNIWGPAAISRDFLLDAGFAEGGFRSFRERTLPRHLFDPRKNGHGLDFRRIELPEGDMIHFLYFYTYDQHGDPEWYLAVGEVDDGMIFEASLGYVTYDAGRTPPQQVDESRHGWVRLDLDPPLDHPSCLELREPDSPYSSPDIIYMVMDWEIEDEADSWCLVTPRFGDLPGLPYDMTGSWFASDPDDDGWGFTIIHRNLGPMPILNTVLYYYDAEGKPAWSWGIGGAALDLPAHAVKEGVEFDKFHYTGYCRTCEAQPIGVDVAGHIRIRLFNPTMLPDSSNVVESMEIQNMGPNGGRWDRYDAGIRLLGSPNPSMDP